jgi:hypothetical protein
MRTNIEKEMLDLCRKIQRMDDINASQLKVFLNINPNRYSFKPVAGYPYTLRLI